MHHNRIYIEAGLVFWMGAARTAFRRLDMIKDRRKEYISRRSFSITCRRGRLIRRRWGASRLKIAPIRDALLSTSRARSRRSYFLNRISVSPTGSAI